MKKLIIIIILIFVALYYFSGRYVTVRQNVSERGIIALRDEPIWLGKLISEKWDSLKQAFDNAIEGKKFSPQAEDIQ